MSFFDQEVAAALPPAPVLDPRPDLVEDHDLWVMLLSRVAAAQGVADGEGLYWALRGARAIGALLTASVETGALRLRSRPGTEADYEAVRLHLLAHAEVLSALLAG